MGAANLDEVYQVLEIFIFASYRHCNQWFLSYYLFKKFQAPPALSSLILRKDQNDTGSAGVKSLRAIALLGAGVSGILSFTTIASADEAEHGLESPSYPWPHQGILSSYDHAS